MQGTDRLADPASVGIDEDALAELRARVQKEVDEGLLPSAQYAIARNGKLAAFETFGDATNDSLYCIFSATKVITSAAAWLLLQEGKLDLDATVASLIPEFGSHGKDVITVEQLFTHTGGFPSAPFRPTDWNDKARRLERFSQWTLNWEPGSQFEYHPTSSMWIIAELIERITGEDFADFVRNRIALPLGLPELYLGCPESEHHRVADVCHVGDALTSEDYAEMGIPEPPVTEVTEEVLLRFNLPETRLVPVPGGGGIASAADLALFYQGLIGNTASGEKLWSDETLGEALKVRTGDFTNPQTGMPVNRALGVVISGDDKRNFRGFGHANSERAFGHDGAGGQVAWVDQETGISFVYCTNGHDRNPIRMGRRGVSLGNRAAVCGLGIAG